MPPSRGRGSGGARASLRLSAESFSSGTAHAGRVAGMRLLILGGTEFVGRAVVEAALARGWEVTVFHRGRHEAPAGVDVAARRPHRAGRACGARATASGTSSSTPGRPRRRAVRDAARLLAGRVGRYVYVSSCSVYAWPPAAGYDETQPGGGRRSPDAGRRAVRGGQAGRGAGRGRRVRRGPGAAGAGGADPRPVGEHRPAAVVAAAGWPAAGPVLAPGPRDTPLQYIDVRDLAEWMLDAAERGLGGPYNLVSEQGHTTMGELLEACVRGHRRGRGAALDAAGGDPGGRHRALDGPARSGSRRASSRSSTTRSMAVDVAKALAAGLRCRPVGGDGGGHVGVAPVARRGGAAAAGPAGGGPGRRRWRRRCWARERAPEAGCSPTRRFPQCRARLRRVAGSAPDPRLNAAG